MTAKVGIEGLLHVAIKTGDLAATRAFYIEVLDLRGGNCIQPWHRRRHRPLFHHLGFAAVPDHRLRRLAG